MNTNGMEALKSEVENFKRRVAEATVELDRHRAGMVEYGQKYEDSKENVERVRVLVAGLNAKLPKRQVIEGDLTSSAKELLGRKHDFEVMDAVIELYNKKTGELDRPYIVIDSKGLIIDEKITRQMDSDLNMLNHHNNSERYNSLLIIELQGEISKREAKIKYMGGVL